MRKSRFNEFLIRHNGLDEFGFEEWIFCPGMLFHGQDTWWEDGGIRQSPHEGLDYCFYRDTGGQNHRLNEKTKIPVMYDGNIVNICDDFLGKSVFVNHDISDDRGNRLHTIYGHTSPYDNVDAGSVFQEGEAFATIADAGKKSTKVLAHLHISVAWVPEAFPRKELNWKTISDLQAITLCDPLEYIDGKYKVERGVLRSETMRIT